MGADELKNLIKAVNGIIDDGLDYTSDDVDIEDITPRHILYCKSKLLIKELGSSGYNTTNGKRIINYFTRPATVKNSSDYKERFNSLTNNSNEFYADSFEKYISNKTVWIDYVLSVFERYYEDNNWQEKYKTYVNKNLTLEILLANIDKDFEEFLSDDYIEWKSKAFIDSEYRASLYGYAVDENSRVRDLYDRAKKVAEEQWLSYGNAKNNGEDAISSEAYRILAENWFDTSYGITTDDIKSIVIDPSNETTYKDLKNHKSLGAPTDEDISNANSGRNTTLSSLVKMKMTDILNSGSLNSYVSWFNDTYDWAGLKAYLMDDERNLLNPKLSAEGLSNVWSWMTDPGLDGGLYSYLNLLEKNTNAIEGFFSSNNCLSSLGIQASFGDVTSSFNNWQKNCFAQPDNSYKNSVSNIGKNISDNETIKSLYNIAYSTARTQWMTRNSKEDSEYINDEAVRLVHLWVNADKSYTIDIFGKDADKFVWEIRKSYPSNDSADSSSEESAEQSDNNNDGADGADKGNDSTSSTVDDRKYIKKSVDTALGKMAYVFQLSQFVSMMPKPVDFVNKISNDVSHLMYRLLDITDKLSKVSESYANIPTEYLMTNINSMFDSASYIVEKTSSFASDLVGQGIGVVNNAIDGMNNAVQGVGNSLDDMRDMLNENSSSIAEYIDFSKITDEEDLNSVNGAVGDIGLINGIDSTVITNSIESAGTVASDALGAAKNSVVKAVEWMREQMSKLVHYVDLLDASMGGEGKTTLSESLKSASAGLVGNSSVETAIGSVFNTTANAIDKISIAGMIESLGGIATYAGICALGLDKLPPIDFVSMLAPLRSSVSSYGEVEKSAEYKQIENEAREELRNARRERDMERRARKEDRDRLKEIRSKSSLSDEENTELKTIEDRISERKRIAKDAILASNYVTELKSQFEYVGAMCDDFAKKIKTDWDESMKQYLTALSEINLFFRGIKTADASVYAKSEGAKYISDCCGRIDSDIDGIVEQCKNIGEQIATAVAEVPIPTSVGPVFDMPIYKVLCFFAEVKTVIKFMFDLMNDGADILIQVNNLANIMLNGINSLTDIVNQIMSLLNIQWIFDLIETLQELFKGKILEGKALIENTISPVYFKDTEEYETLSDQFDDFLNSTEGDTTNIDSNTKFSLKGYTEKNKLKTYTISYGNVSGNTDADLAKIEEMEAALEQRGNNEISYYFSPMLSDDGTEIAGYHYYYNNVDSYFKGKLKRKFKKRLIKKAAKSGSREKGGVNFLRNKRLKYDSGVYSGKSGTAYDAFYWYTKYTNDPNDYAADMSNVGIDTVGKILGTGNGSLVELENGDRVFVNSTNVNAGDIITVNGIRYRVV